MYIILDDVSDQARNVVMSLCVLIAAYVFSLEDVSAKFFQQSDACILKYILRYDMVVVFEQNIVDPF